MTSSLLSKGTLIGLYQVRMKTMTMMKSLELKFLLTKTKNHLLSVSALEVVDVAELLLQLPEDEDAAASLQRSTYEKILVYHLLI